MNKFLVKSDWDGKSYYDDITFCSGVHGSECNNRTKGYFRVTHKGNTKSLCTKCIKLVPELSIWYNKEYKKATALKDKINAIKQKITNHVYYVDGTYLQRKYGKNIYAIEDSELLNDIKILKQGNVTIALLGIKQNQICVKTNEEFDDEQIQSLHKLRVKIEFWSTMNNDGYMVVPV